MRCPACGERNSDKAVVCELCQAPLRGQGTTAPRTRAPTPAVPPAPAVQRPVAPAASAPPPRQVAAPAGRPAVFYLPQPKVVRRRGALTALLALAVLGGGGVLAARHWPHAPAPPTSAAIATPAAAEQVPAPAPPPARPAHATPEPEPRPALAAPPPHDRRAPAPPGQPLVEITPPDPRGGRSVSASWFEGAEGLGRAKREQEYGNVPMILYFRVDWCPYCRRMDQDLTSSALRELLADVVKVRINPEASPADAEVARSMGVKGYPSVYVVPRPGSAPEKIPSLARKEDEPVEPAAAKLIAAVKQAGVRQVQQHIANGASQLARGDLPGARAELDRAIAMNPRSAEAYYWRGAADAKAGEPGKAAGYFKRALELDPERKDALFGLANLYGQNRQYDDAITYLTRAIRVDPGYAHGTAFAQRGHSYQMKGDTVAAQADFAEACRRGTTSACGQGQP